MSGHSHFRMMACLYSSLRALSGQGNAHYVAVQTPLFYDESHKHLAKQPDVMVIKGINDQDRAQYLLWDEGQTPAVIFEITSGNTWMEDLVNKSSL
ncbi:MAG: Uma2 family endonuclease, partial [Caldilineaceae bacterium]|nr:Uma2 family endonuclease [Caldilineaceae bacterium]